MVAYCILLIFIFCCGFVVTFNFQCNVTAWICMDYEGNKMMHYSQTNLTDRKWCSNGVNALFLAIQLWKLSVNGFPWEFSCSFLTIWIKYDILGTLSRCDLSDKKYRKKILVVECRITEKKGYAIAKVGVAVATNYPHFKIF